MLINHTKCAVHSRKVTIARGASFRSETQGGAAAARGGGGQTGLAPRPWFVLTTAFLRIYRIDLQKQPSSCQRCAQLSHASRPTSALSLARRKERVAAGRLLGGQIHTDPQNYLKFKQNLKNRVYVCMYGPDFDLFFFCPCIESTRDD